MGGGGGGSLRVFERSTDHSPRYAVFPERLEVMAQSNLMKVVGRVGGEMVTIEGRLRDSGWALIMPEAMGPDSQSSTSTPAQTPLSNMMKWVTGEQILSASLYKQASGALNKF